MIARMPVAVTRHSSPVARHSFVACRRITAAANSSFPLAFRLLPPHKRRAMDALYAFMRVTDDISDEPDQNGTRRQNLVAWRHELLAALAGHPAAHPVFPALAHVVCRFDIPARHLLDVIDGVESDLEPVRFATFAEL